MIAALRTSNKWREILFFAGLSMFCVSLSAFRILHTETRAFIFMNWNLFLAFIPWFLSSLIVLKPKVKKNKIVILSLLTVWLLFFPNAPYILTDLYHLRFHPVMPMWFDLVMILSFAWTGLLFGFFSLWDIELLFSQNMNKRLAATLVTLLIFIGSFGVYLGRYLRWNSWDIIREPFAIIYDIGDRLVNPFDHPRTWGMTLFMGIFLNLLYWSFRLIRK